jgi:hypothetical protein
MRAFKTEWLRPARSRLSSYEFSETPHYELYGERQVAAGHYENVIRYRQHVLLWFRHFRISPSPSAAEQLAHTNYKQYAFVSRWSAA